MASLHPPVVVTVTGGGGPGAEEKYKLLMDDVGAGVAYVGEADPGTAASSAAWRIKRVTETGDDTAVEWADGTAAFTKIWDSRAGYSYS